MLAEALRTEADAYVARFAGERCADPPRLAVRNGTRRLREVRTGDGAVEVTAPRVNDWRVVLAAGRRYAVVSCRRRASTLLGSGRLAG